MTINEARINAAAKLNPNIENPFLEVDILLSLLLSYSKADIITRSGEPITDNNYNKILSAVQRRNSNEPLAYITQSKEFYGYEFYVDPSVLVPRPETETLVELALDYINLSQKPSLDILEIGTGSGCIPISIALSTNKQINMTCYDKSDNALQVAKSNKQKLIPHKYLSKIEFIQQDIFQVQDTNEKYDLIISNPPYINTAHLTELDKTVSEFEPHLALDGGIDGLDFYRKIADILPTIINPGGILLLEIYSENVTQISKLFSSFKIEIITDYAKKPRYLKLCA